jgi:hypothetical protein
MLRLSVNTEGRASFKFRCRRSDIGTYFYPCFFEVTPANFLSIIAPYSSITIPEM